MLTFHEGLPGSGKSYAAVQDYLLPAVKAGQKVFTNIKGINHQAIADYCDIDLEMAQHLVVQIPWEQTKDAADLVENDSLVIIDEVQDFWPVSNKPLSPRDMEFVTQHRQRGLELVACGQVMRDCHSLWKRRVERKVMFVNQEAVGKPENYLWTSYNATQPEVFEKIASGTGEYKAEVYNCYKSVATGVTRISKTKDDRFNPIKAITGSKWVWLYVAAFCSGLYLLVGFFDRDKAIEQGKQAQQQLKPQSINPQQEKPPAPISTPRPPPENQPDESFLAQKIVKTWQIVGFYSNGKKTTVLIRNESGQFRYITKPDELILDSNDIYITLEGEKIASWTK